MLCLVFAVFAIARPSLRYPLAVAAITTVFSSIAAAATLLSNEPVALPDYWTVQSTNRGALLGWTVASAGDINRDGFPEVFVGAPALADQSRRVGGIHVFAGSPQGLGAEPAWSILGQWKDGRFGEAAGAGADVTGDAYPDVMVAVPRSGIARAGEVSVLLYAGSAEGLKASSVRKFRFRSPQTRPEANVCIAGDVNGDGFKDIIVSAPAQSGTSRGAAAWLLYGSANGLVERAAWMPQAGNTNSYLGSFIGAAGDVNRDGFDDVLVGAPLFSNDMGRACLFLGSRNSLSNQPDWTVGGTDPYDRFGGAVAGLGDINGDGFGDVAIGAPGRHREQPRAGKVFVFLGSRDGLLQDPSSVVAGESVGSAFGRFIAGPGDVNGDGRGDLLVSATEQTHTAKYEGRVYLYLGSADGLQPAPRLIIDGGSPHCRFGGALAGAGDINQDGLKDFLIGSPRFRNGDLASGGRVDLFYGSRVAYRSAVHLVARSNAFEPFVATAIVQTTSEPPVTLATLPSPGPPAPLWPWLVSATILAGCVGAFAWLWRHRLAAVERERARIARDLHDDLGASLTRLSLAGETATAPAHSHGSAQRVAEDARRAMAAMRDIVWRVDPANDSLDKLATFLGQKAHEMFADTAIRCFTEIPIALPHRAIPAHLRQNLFLAVKEALHNSLRHARAENVWLRLRFNDPELQILVEDDGSGMPPNITHASGNGMRNMRHRMADIGGAFSIEPRTEGGIRVSLRAKL